MREFFVADGRRLSYLDFGGPGVPLLVFHGHFNEAAAFVPLADALAPRWRVIALDQRGHGESGRAPSYGREGYVADIAAFHRHLGLGPAAVAGHSLGGVNAYQYAARHPGRVTALVVEDIGAVINSDRTFIERLPRSASSRPALMTALGAAAPYLECSVRRSAEGWSYSFDLDDTGRSEQAQRQTDRRARPRHGCPRGWPGRTGRACRRARRPSRRARRVCGYRRRLPRQSQPGSTGRMKLRW